MTEVERIPERKETINPQAVAVSMIGHYPGYIEGGSNTTSVRGELALQTLGKIVDHGYRAVIAMSVATPQEFIDKFPREVIVLRGDAMVDRARASVKRASELEGVEAIFYTQPEKEDIIGFIPELVAPILNGTADLSLAKRDKELFEETFPEDMVRLEKHNNRRANGMLRACGLRTPEQADLDLFFGVNAFRNKPEIIEIYLKTWQFKQGITVGSRKHASTIPETGMGISIIPWIEIMAGHFEIASPEVSFRYPEVQRENEEHPDNRSIFLEKRRRQGFVINTEVNHQLRLLAQTKRESLLTPIKVGAGDLR